MPSKLPSAISLPHWSRVYQTADHIITSWHGNPFHNTCLRYLPWITSGFHSRRPGNGETWCFLSCRLWSCWSYNRVTCNLRRHDAHLMSQQCQWPFCRAPHPGPVCGICSSAKAQLEMRTIHSCGWSNVNTYDTSATNTNGVRSEIKEHTSQENLDI